MGAAALYINGEEVNTHFCGYTPFVTDISDFVNCGTDNEVLITLDNSDNPLMPPGKPQRDLDFSYDGGLYRGVTLTVCEPLYVTDPLLANETAGGGLFIRSAVTDDGAVINIKAHIKNEYSENKEYSAIFSLVAQNDETVGKNNISSKLLSKSAEYIESVLEVEDPLLWSPEEPALYTLITELSVGGETVYEDRTDIGIRDFEFTLNDGVIFNGKSRRFSSANYHQTWPYIGNAVPASLLERDLIKLKRAGFDNIRSERNL